MIHLLLYRLFQIRSFVVTNSCRVLQVSPTRVTARGLGAKRRICSITSAGKFANESLIMTQSVGSLKRSVADLSSLGLLWLLSSSLSRQVTSHTLTATFESNRSSNDRKFEEERRKSWISGGFKLRQRARIQMTRIKNMLSFI
jgi:hypothetical protein